MAEVRDYTKNISSNIFNPSATAVNFKSMIPEDIQLLNKSRT